MAQAKQKKRLTDNLLKNLEHNGKEYTVWDSMQPGLCVKVGGVRGKALAVKFRLGQGRGGLQRFPKIGDWPTLSIDDARYKAAELVAAGRHNIDLLEEKKVDEKQREIDRVNKILKQYNAANPDDPSFLKSAWLTHAALKKSAQSKKTHSNLVARFRHFETLFKQDVKTTDLKPEDMEKLRQHLIGKPVEFNATIAALSSVLNNEIYEKRIDRNICKRVRLYPATYRDVVLTDAGYDDFVEYFSDLNNFEFHRRNYARMLLAMLYTGWRNSMLISLMRKDSGSNNFLDGNVAVFRNHKTAKKKSSPERVAISIKAMQIMHDAMDATPASPYVFGSHDQREHFKNSSLSQTVVEKMANTVADKFETEGGGKFTAYVLRHTFGTRAIAKGAPVVFVSRAMLHSDLRTTMRYVKTTEKSRQEMADFVDANF